MPDLRNPPPLRSASIQVGDAVAPLDAAHARRPRFRVPDPAPGHGPEGVEDASTLPVRSAGRHAG